MSKNKKLPILFGKARNVKELIEMLIDLPEETEIMTGGESCIEVYGVPYSNASGICYVELDPCGD